MKKYLFSWMTIVLMTFVCVGFVACGSDDDDNSSSSSQLIGTWYQYDNGYIQAFKGYLDFSILSLRFNKTQFCFQHLQLGHSETHLSGFSDRTRVEIVYLHETMKIIV